MVSLSWSICQNPQKEAFHFIGNSNPDPEVVDHLRITILEAAEWVINATCAPNCLPQL